MVWWDLDVAGRAWAAVAPVLFVPRDERACERLVAVLEALNDTVREAEDHRSWGSLDAMRDATASTTELSEWVGRVIAQ